MISIDGNFGLVRKRSAGTSCCPPKLQGRHFLDQNAVDAWVAEKEKNKRQGAGGDGQVSVSKIFIHVKTKHKTSIFSKVAFVDLLLFGFLWQLCSTSCVIPSSSINQMCKKGGYTIKLFGY